MRSYYWGTYHNKHVINLKAIVLRGNGPLMRAIRLLKACLARGSCEETCQRFLSVQVYDQKGKRNSIYKTRQPNEKQLIVTNGQSDTLKCLKGIKKISYVQQIEVSSTLRFVCFPGTKCRCVQ